MSPKRTRIVNRAGVYLKLFEHFADGTTKVSCRWKKSQIIHLLSLSQATEWTVEVRYKSLKTNKNVGQNSATETTKRGITHHLNAFTEPDLLDYLTQEKRRFGQ